MLQSHVFAMTQARRIMQMDKLRHKQTSFITKSGEQIWISINSTTSAPLSCSCRALHDTRDDDVCPSFNFRGS